MDGRDELQTTALRLDPKNPITLRWHEEVIRMLHGDDITVHETKGATAPLLMKNRGMDFVIGHADNIFAVKGTVNFNSGAECPWGRERGIGQRVNSGAMRGLGTTEWD